MVTKNLAVGNRNFRFVTIFQSRCNAVQVGATARGNKPSVGLAKSVQKHTKKRLKSLVSAIPENTTYSMGWISILLRSRFSHGRLGLAAERVISHHTASQSFLCDASRG